MSSDDQREKKASFDQSGVYTLVAIPESFRGLYKNKSSGPTSPGTNGHLFAQQFQSTRPDVVILRKFVGYPGSRSWSQNPLSRKPSLEDVSSPDEISTTPVDRETDSYLLDHYRNVLANQICWLAEQVSGPDVFERCSADYFPVSENKGIKSRHLLIAKLYLAILALSSLSLSQSNHIPFEDVL